MRLAMAKALDMVEFGKMRYNLLGSGDHWFAGHQVGQITLDDEVTISENAWRMQGSRMFIEVGSRVSVEELLLGMIVQSGNDASVALAEHLAGSEAEAQELTVPRSADLALRLVDLQFELRRN